MPEAVSLWHIEYSGKVVGVNLWKEPFAFTARGGKPTASMHLSTEYRKFRDDFAMCCRATGKCMRAGYCDALIEIHLWKQRDSDNPIKPILDALAHAGIIEDDKFIRNISIIRDYHKRGKPDYVSVALELAAPESISHIVTG